MKQNIDPNLNRKVFLRETRIISNETGNWLYAKKIVVLLQEKSDPWFKMKVILKEK